MEVNPKSYHSQEGQDRWLDDYVFKGFRNGVFFDVGAYDGSTFSNTFFFERERGWTGVHCEPMTEIFEKLEANRPRSLNLNVAVADKNGVAKFYRNTSCTEMLSGLVDHYDPRHTERVVNANKQHVEATTCVIDVPTKRMDLICEEHCVDHIHYLSIDVEGGELAVVESIDFEKVFIDAIGFEVNFADSGKVIEEFLKGKGYKVVFRCLDTIMVHSKSPFCQPDW